MKRFMIALAAVVAVLALSACGGAGYDSSDSPPAARSGNDTATVSVKELGDSGRVLVDSAGKALYAAERKPIAASSAPAPALPSGSR
jgi:predicted small lipoprotein YifL